ncbi:MAG: branched-chain amino acid ABC transporter permease [Actinomycetota bacterium]|nr:branched-chain amino acid ABC transporter permease [Actinomycetota bacterium]
MTFDSFVNQFWPSTVSGLVLGSVYALIALGYTLVYGVLRLINFANSEVFMFSAFGSFLAIDLLGIPDLTIDRQYPYKTGLVLIGVLAFCLLVSMIIGAVSAVVLERVAYRPLRKRNAPRLVFLISAIGASFAMSEAVGEWGPKHREEYKLPRVFEKQKLFSIFGADVRNDHLIIVVGSLIMMGILVLFVNRSRTGRGIRAVAQDMETAKLMGVNVDMIILVTFLVGGVMAGAAAFFFELYNGTARYSLGFELGVKAFTAAVLGGIGNIKGALLGGLMLGIIENWGTSLFQSNQKMGSVTAFVVLVLVLVLRPTGLLGESMGRSKA